MDEYETIDPEQAPSLSGEIIPAPKKPEYEVIREGEVFDVIVHPYKPEHTARLYHSNGAVRADGSCGQHPGTYVVPLDEANNPDFYRNKIRTSEQGRALVAQRWENSRRAFREGIVKAVQEKKGIPPQQMNNEVAVAVMSEELTKGVLDEKTSLRDKTNTTKFLTEKSELLPPTQAKSETAPVAIQINVSDGLFSESFADEEENE